MENQPKTTAKDFFLNLGAIIALYFFVISFINLIFAIINKYFPDAASYGYYYDMSSATIRWSVSAIIVLFPLYLFLQKTISKEIVLIPEKKHTWVKRWSTYLTLFLTGATIAVDLIFLVYSFLGGEVTTRFFLKVLAVLFVALSVFVYYLHDLKRTDYVNDRKVKLLFWKSIIIVSLAVIGAFLTVGSPLEERERKLDDQRVNDLSSIQSEVLSYWQMKGELPKELSDLDDSLSYFILPVDPETKAPYEYSAMASTTFELCATFAAPARIQEESMARPYYEGLSGSFPHGEGRTCFERTIDPERYSVKKPQI